MALVPRQQPAFGPTHGEPFERIVSFVCVGSRAGCSQQFLRFVKGFDGALESPFRARVFTAFAVRPPLTLVNRSLGQARPEELREQISGMVQILMDLADEAAHESL